MTAQTEKREYGVEAFILILWSAILPIVKPKERNPYLGSANILSCNVASHQALRGSSAPN